MPHELNYHHLYYFWRCARAGSITAAARRLHLSQPALSAQLKRLERALGRRLLERGRGGVELTDPGREVMERCERIFPEGEALAEAFLGGRAGGPARVRVAVTSALGRELALAALARLESASVVPTLYMAAREDVREKLARREVDVALSGVDLSRELSGVRARRVQTLPLVFVASPALARRLPAFPRRGTQPPMLMRSRQSPVRALVERWLRARGVRPALAAESEDVDLLTELARRGWGVAALHEASVRADLASGRLRRVRAPGARLTHEVWVAAPERAPADPALGAAVETLFSAKPLL